MKNKILLLLLAFLSLSTIAQDKYMTRNGNISFEASVASFESIEANHKNVTALLNVKNGDFAALVLIRGFKFKIALMEEHFNENYMESDDFPKATFKGNIANFDFEKIKNINQKFTLEGSLSIHGKAQNIKTQITLNNVANNIEMAGAIKVNLVGYGIKIPSIVKGKISEEVNINLKFDLNPKM